MSRPPFSAVRRLAGRLLPAAIRRPLARWLWREIDLQFEVRGLPCQIESRADWQALEEVFLQGVYDRAIGMALERADRGRPVPVLDLGAHIGLFTLRMLGAMSDSGRPLADAVVFAVEGLPPTAARLARNVESWRRAGADVRVSAGLVGRRSGAGAIVLGGSDLGASVHGREGRTYTAACVDLDALVAGLPEFALVKCDIEGAEVDFVEEYGALLARTNVLVIEVHPQAAWTEVHEERVRAAGLVPVAPAGPTDEESRGPVLMTWVRERAEVGGQ